MDLQTEQTAAPFNIFVYGTLKKDYGNHRLVEHCQQVEGEHLLRIECLSGHGFPYAKFAIDQQDETNPYLRGEVYVVEDEYTLARLDSLE